MATWKKVIVSGSTANLANLQVDGLTSGQVVIGGGTAGNLTTTAINGTGNIVATTGATGVSMTGSFTGSFTGNGAGLTGVTATAIFPTSAVTNITSTDKFFISQSTNEFITYGNLLTDLAGTNLAVESSDSLTLATTITGITSISSTSFTGSLLGTASYASNADLLDGLNSTSFVLNSQTSSMLAPYVLTSQTSSMSVLSSSYALSASNAATASSTVGTLSAIGAGGISLSNDFNGSTGSAIALNGYAGFTSNGILKWNGSSFTNSSITDDGTTISTAASIQAGGSNSILTGSFSGSFVGALTGTASFATSASQAGVVASIASNVTNNTNNYILTATGGGSINGESNLSFDGSLLTVSGNATITGDLTVAGTASFTNTDNLNIRDKFILINSGSSTLADSGWITQYNAAGSGSAFYLDATSAGTYGRFAVAYDVLGTATSVTVDEFVVTAKVNQSAPGAATPTWGGNGTNGQGNMWLTSTGDIYIWA
jgi:hypothetical protein